MRVYISGGITNVPDYAERFARAEEKLIALGYEVINPARVNAELPPMEWEEYMRMSLLMISMADSAYFLTGWQESRGACMEYGYAVAKGMRIIEE